MVARVERGVIGRPIECKPTWCRVEIQGLLYVLYGSVYFTPLSCQYCEVTVCFGSRGSVFCQGKSNPGVANAMSRMGKGPKLGCPDSAPVQALAQERLGTMRAIDNPKGPCRPGKAVDGLL